MLTTKNVIVVPLPYVVPTSLPSALLYVDVNCYSRLTITQLLNKLQHLCIPSASSALLVRRSHHQILKNLCTFSAEGNSRYTIKLLNLWLLPHFSPGIATIQILKYLCTVSAEGNSRYTIKLLNLWLLPHFLPRIATIQILKYLCTFSAEGNSRYTIKLKLLKKYTIPD